jgi:hypothetical protein
VKGIEHLARELCLKKQDATYLWNAVGRSMLMALRDFEAVKFQGILYITWREFRTQHNCSMLRLKLSPAAKSDLKKCRAVEILARRLKQEAASKDRSVDAPATHNPRKA